MTASGVTSATRKAATVLTLLGTEIQELVRTLPVPVDAGSDEFSQLTAKLKAHFEANVNVTYERAQLHAFTRKDGENFRSFVSRLRIQADRCQYSNDQRDQVILECAVAHCQDRELQKFFVKPNLTLIQALEIAKQDEDVRAQIDSLGRRLSAVALSEPAAVHTVMDKPGNRPKCAQTERRGNQPGSQDFRPARQSRNPVHSYSPDTQENCYRCLSKRHSSGECPFKKAECYRCHKLGHTQSACRSRRLDFNLLMTDGPQQPTEVTSGSADDHYQLNNVSDRSAAVVVAMDINKVSVPMQVDTGSSRSIISKKLYNKLWVANPPKLKAAERPMLTYTQDEVPVVGVAEVNVTYNGQTATLPLVVADTEGPPLLGREWLQKIRLDWTALFDPVQSMA